MLAAALAAASASAQTLPLAFGNVQVGIAPGGTATACSTTLPTASGNTVPGDGCLGTQATLNAPYGVNVDNFGNLYIADYNTFSLRVLYKGGTALAAAIQAANPTQTFTPQVGYVYTIAGGRQAALAQTKDSAGHSAYYCNGAGSGIAGIGSNGDGCPATYGYVKPRSMVIDPDGNILFNSGSGGPARVVYLGGTFMANLISTLNSGAVAQVGYIYSLAKSASNGYAGDGALATDSSVRLYSMRDVALDSARNIYLSDGNTGGASTNNDVRRIDGVTGIITTYAGSAGCASGSAGCTSGSTGDGGAATAALFASPYTIFFDKYDNLYITDYNNAKLRVVYKAGSIPGLSNLTAGYVYTVAGGGSTASTVANQNAAATSYTFGTVYSAGIDGGGNIYMADGTSKLVWRIDATTGKAIVVAGGKSSTTAGTVCATGSTLTATDKIGDGCPATQLTFVPSGKIPFDRFGNYYETENGNAVVRQYNFNTQFPATLATASATQPLAFLSVPAQTLATESFTNETSAAVDFMDAGSGNCSLNSALSAATTCVFNVAFAPKRAGLRRGSISLSSAAATLVTEPIGGTGIAANLSVDPATVTNLGSSLTPSGLATDASGNVYVADSASNQLLKFAAGSSTSTTLLTGLSSPGQVAVDGAGNVYVADTNASRIAVRAAAASSTTATTIGTGFNKPQGLVADATGNLYVADTGNNRIVEISPLGNQIALTTTGLSSPTRLALDATGNLYIADTGNNRIVELPVLSEQTTINLGTATVTPLGLAVDAAGTLYIADSVSGQVLSYAPGITNPTALITALSGPKGLALDLNGSLYLADASASSVIVANRNTPTETFPGTNLNTSNTTPLVLANTGNAALSFTGSTFANATGSTAAFTLAPSSTNGCSLATGLAIASECSLDATFTPTATTSYTATENFTTNALNAASVTLTGSGVSLVNTTTALVITQPTTSTISYAQSVTVQATVTPASVSGAAPSGTITFSVDGKKQTAQTVPANGIVTLALSPAVGTHAISVQYSGDTVYASSSSSTSFTVQQASTTTKLAITPTASGQTPTLTLTATVASTTATGETGTVSFYAGSTLLGTVALGTNATAAYTTTTLIYSSYAFTAVYSGDTNFSTSTSSSTTAPGDFLVIPIASTTSTPQGGVATWTANLTPLFNYSGTITASCAGLPANSVCRFSPTSMSLSGGTTQLFSVYVYTNTNPQLASLLTPFGGSSRWLTLACALPLLGLAFFATRRRAWLHTTLAIAFLALSFGVTGCSSGSLPEGSAGQYVTPQGTSSVVITFKDSAGVTHSITVALTVLAPYSS